MHIRFSFFLALFAPLWAIGVAAQPGQDVARILVPLDMTMSSPVPGAEGSLWVVEGWFSYSGDQSVPVVPGLSPCPGTCDNLRSWMTPVRDPYRLQPDYVRESGILIQVPTEHLRQFRISARVRDVSRATDSAGTEVPVVPDTDFSSDAVRLANVPNPQNGRTALRVYALPEVAAPQVEVRYYRMPRDHEGGVLLKTERYDLVAYAPVAEFLLNPSFIMIANIQAEPELAGADALFIDIVPLVQGLKVWAMASTTNNETQQVTIVSPQP